MDSPYRSAPGTNNLEVARDAGIVDDIIGQFADTLAFYRELIQNSIDADTETITIRIDYDTPQQVLRVRVEDAGCGMTKEVIEDQLLVLFRSTKEGVSGKIGKFGIGFVSVLAVSPSLVKVISSSGGIRHTLHLYSDLNYELFESGRSTKNSTIVELEIQMKPVEANDFISSSSKALHRWCRHATVMITFEAYGPGGKLVVSERIDRPIALEGALACVEMRSRDGTTIAFVGVTAQQYSAFFNHGLLLYESTEPLIGSLSFVIQDARLGHTLSRDNVRHDKHYEHALEFIRDAGDSLPDEIARVMQAALLESDYERYRALADFVFAAPDIELDLWPLPLISPIKSKQTVDMTSFVSKGCWVATSASPLTVALALMGTPVVDLRVLLQGGVVDALLSSMGEDVKEVERELSLVSPIAPSGSDMVLLDRLGEILEDSYRKPSQLLFAAVTGHAGNSLSVVSTGGDRTQTQMPGDSWILNKGQLSRNPFRRFLRPALILNTNCSQVEQARERAKEDVDVVAHTLARLLLLEYEMLDVRRSEALLASGIENVLKGGG